MNLELIKQNGNIYELKDGTSKREQSKIDKEKHRFRFGKCECGSPMTIRVNKIIPPIINIVFVFKLLPALVTREKILVEPPLLSGGNEFGFMKLTIYIYLFRFFLLKCNI